MREDRNKKNKKVLKILNSNGFRKPYQIVVDSGFMKHVRSVDRASEKISSVLKNVPKFFTTECEYSKYRAFIKSENSENRRNVRDVTGECEIIKCGHKEPVESCVDQYIKNGNKNHFILAFWGDRDREDKILKMNIPILRYKNSVFYVYPGELKVVSTKYQGSTATTEELKKLKKMYGDDEQSN